MIVAVWLAALPVEAERPKVAVVLSGGGALGIAHIGVLQVLEELHVPVDIVAGTSMGAIVGGLYAAGYSPGELERIVGSLDWRTILHDRPDRRSLPYRRKMDDFLLTTPWELGLAGGKLRVPSGLIAGHRLGVELRIRCLRAVGVSDFSCLPTPFRAVATDLETGEMVVLADGDLATALMASMAFPGVFSPVQIGDRLLTDGGMVRNLPVDVARQMGADIVIAVDVGEPLASGGRPTSVPAVLSHATGMMTRLNVENSLRDADLVIHPDVGAYGLLQFDRCSEILPRGRRAAEASQEDLKILALPPEEWAKHEVGRRRPTPPVRLAEVSVDPGKGLASAAVTQRVRTRPGKDLDPDLLRQDLERVYDTGEYETVDFALSPGADGWTLAITGRPKEWGPNYLRFGAAAFTDLDGGASLSFLASMTMTRVDRRGAELQVGAAVGSSPAVSAEFYQPLSASGPIFAALLVQASRTQLNVDVEGSYVEYHTSDTGAAAFLGLALGSPGEIRFGLRRDFVTALPEGSHPAAAPRSSGTDTGYEASLRLDQFDSASFSKEGFLAIVQGRESEPQLGSDFDYRRLDVDLYCATSFRRHSMIGFLKATTAFGGELPVGQGRALGGLHNLSGLAPGEISGNYGGVAGLIYFFNLGQMPPLVHGLYVGASLESGNVWQHQSDVSLGDLRRSVSIALGADTILGPASVAYGRSSYGENSYYLYLGRTF